RKHFRAALALARNPMERQFLKQRVGACERGDPLEPAILEPACREKSQAKKCSPDFIRGSPPNGSVAAPVARLMTRKNWPPSAPSNVLKAGGRISWRTNAMHAPCYCFGSACWRRRSP